MMELIFDKKKPIIPQYLEALDKFAGRGFARWVLNNGKGFKPLSRKEYEKLNSRIDRRGYKQYKKVKMCYYNSQMICADLHRRGIDAKYYEGYYLTDKIPIPLEHAWVVIEEKLYETTPHRDVSEYFGVEIPIVDVLNHQVETGMAEPLLWRRFTNAR